MTPLEDFLTELVDLQHQWSKKARTDIDDSAAEVFYYCSTDLETILSKYDLEVLKENE